MKKSLLVAAALMLLSPLAMAQQSVTAKAYKCSNGGDYTAMISVLSGMTVSYRLLAFCTKAAGTDLQSCLSDNSEGAEGCFAEFKRLNQLRAGDGGLVIVQGRE